MKQLIKPPKMPKAHKGKSMKGKNPSPMSMSKALKKMKP